MHNRFLFFCCCLLTALTGAAQVTMSVQVPPTGVVQKSQLWNLVLINTGNTPADVSIRLTLLTVNDNKPVMTAATRLITLYKGAKQVGINEVSPVQYSYLSPAFNADRSPGGFLPVGNYQACYTISKVVSDNTTELAEECIPLEVAPLTPPQLNTPFDRDTVQSPYPSFTWLPPAPLPLFNDLSYDIVVVELRPGQSSLQAIQQNLPVYSAGDVDELAHAYPASNKALDTAKWYAWRVIARNNHQMVAQSEVWTFTVKGMAPPGVKPVYVNYILLGKDRRASGVNQVEDRMLGVKYHSYDPPYGATVRITGADGIVVQEIQQAVAHGDNLFSYKLGNSYEKGKVYKIEIADRNGNRYTALFTLN